MARPRIHLEQSRDFTGGLNTSDDAYNLAPNESFDLMDVDIDRRGGVSSRRGRSIVDAGDDWWPADMIHFWRTPSGADFMIYGEYDGYIGIIRMQAEEVPIWIKLSDEDALPRVAEMGGKIYAVMDGAPSICIEEDQGDPDGWSYKNLGEAFSNDISNPTEGNMPRGQVIAQHNHVMWVANQPNHPCRIRWSHPGKPEAWRENDWIDLDPEDGNGPITALVPFGERLIVFKSRAIYAIHGYAPNGFSVMTLTKEVGAPSQEAVVATEDGIFFWDQTRGAWAFDGQGFHWIFQKVSDLLDRGVINRETWEWVSVEWFNERAWFVVPWTRAPHAGAMMNLVFYPLAGGGESGGAWTIHSFVGGRQRTYIDHAGKPHLYGIEVVTHPLPDPDDPLYGLWWLVEYDVADRATDERVHRDSDTDIEVPITAHYTTRWYDASNAALKKRWKRPVVVANAEGELDLLVEAFKDYDPSTVRRQFKLTSETATGDMTWDRDSWDQAHWVEQTGITDRSATHRGAPLGNGVAVALRFATNPANPRPWAVHGVTMKYIPKRIRS